MSCHLSVLTKQQAAKYGEKSALRYKDYDQNKWIQVSWNQFENQIQVAARALYALGVKEEENIAILSQNKPESFVVDFGGYRNRAVTVPLYATSSPEQVRYIVEDAQIRFLFIGEQFQYDAAIAALPHVSTLERLIIYDEKVKKSENDTISMYFSEFMNLGKDESLQPFVDERSSKASFEDLANILYTSGTTGEPKGVQLTHANYDEALKIHEEILTTISDKDVSMNFLPITHVFERAWCYVCFNTAMEVCVNLRPSEILQSIQEIRPTVMCNVPRFWEKVYIGVQEKIAKSKGITRAMMKDAIRVGKIHNVDYVRAGKTPPALLHLKYKFYERTVYAKLKKVLGLENINIVPVAGAAVSQEVCDFAKSVGINMCVGYGLTESTATVCCFPCETPFYEIGSVGRIVPRLEVRIGENDEILLRGRTITKGYYKKPEATAQAIDSEGWFHTGDAGYVKNGFIFLTERIKDLFKTSNGKYISPQALETKLAVDSYFEQVAVIADRFKFVSALIVPNFAAVEQLAKDRGIDFTDREDLLSKPEINAFYKERIDILQQSFAHYEQIKRFTLLSRPFSMEKGELTNTLKLRRSVVNQNFKELIDKMYQE